VSKTPAGLSLYAHTHKNALTVEKEGPMAKNDKNKKSNEPLVPGPDRHPR
jgi:hypothetical protein